jgi:NADH-quinone oxidoreductase subunit G
MDTVAITVNGRPVEVPAGVTLLEALRRQGIELPTLCHDERLTPYGGCRLCVVARRDRRPGLVPACSTPVLPGMEIDTEAPEVHEARRRQLQLILLNHRMECPVCERTGDCRLQDLVFVYGGDESRLPFDLVRRPRDTASPLIVRDPEKCILCAKCVRLCDEVQGVAAIGVVGRGLGARVATWLDGPLECEFCGQCVDACPVAALTIPSFVSDLPTWQRKTVTTTCSYCSCGCELTVATEAAQAAVSASPDSQPNHGKLCAKGRFGLDVLHHRERLTQPLLRRGGRLVEASWGEALAAAVSGLAAARRRGETLAAVGSTRLTTEDAYLLQRFVRDVLGSPHVSAGADPGVEALVAGIGEALGAPRSTATIADLAAADTVLVLRADPGRTHPLVKTELVAAARRGAGVLLAHPGPATLAGLAARHVAVAPGREEILLLGVIEELVRRRGGPGPAVEGAEGLEIWRLGLEECRPAAVSALAGVAAADLARLADRLEAASSLVVTVATGRGLPGDEAGVTRRAVELLAVLGLLGRPGSGVLVLGEKANAQGVVLAGLDHRLAHGGGTPGWSAAETIRRAAAGEVGALYVVGQDLLGSWPQGPVAAEAVERARFVVVQDPFLTGTGRAADVVLPVRCLVERAGSLVGADGVRRRLTPARPAPAPLPGDGDLLRELAVRLGASLPGDAEVDAELERVCAAAAVPALRLAPPPEAQTGPPVTDMVLDLGPQLFHSGLTTSRSEALVGLAAPETVLLPAVDARRLGIERGDTVCIRAGTREVLLRAEVSDRLGTGTAMALWGGDAGGAGRLVVDPRHPLAVEIRRRP